MTTLNSFTEAANRNPVVNIFIKKNGVVAKSMSFVSQVGGGFQLQGAVGPTKSAEEIASLLDQVAEKNSATIEIV